MGVKSDLRQIFDCVEGLNIVSPSNQLPPRATSLHEFRKDSVKIQ